MKNQPPKHVSAQQSPHFKQRTGPKHGESEESSLSTYWHFISIDQRQLTCIIQYHTLQILIHNGSVHPKCNRKGRLFFCQCQYKSFSVSRAALQTPIVPKPRQCPILLQKSGVLRTKWHCTGFKIIEFLVKLLTLRKEELHYWSSQQRKHETILTRKLYLNTSTKPIKVGYFYIKNGIILLF